MRKGLLGVGLGTMAALVLTVGVASARPWDGGDRADRQAQTPRPAIVRSVRAPEAVRPVRAPEAVRPVRGPEAVRPVSVPEIDARSGVAALAAVCAALALAWERRRNA